MKPSNNNSSKPSLEQIKRHAFDPTVRYVNDKCNNKSGNDVTCISAETVQQKSQFRNTESTDSKNKEITALGKE